jgi:hypothetical protein
MAHAPSATGIQHPMMPSDYGQHQHVVAIVASTIAHDDKQFPTEFGPFDLFDRVAMKSSVRYRSESPSRACAARY